MNVDELLELLKYSAIREEIKNIINDEKIVRINEDEIHTLREQNASLMLEKNQLLIDFQTIELVNNQNVEKLQKDLSTLEASQEELINENIYYKNLVLSYEEKYFIFEKFIHLPEEIKKVLSGIFKKEEYENFIVCGCQRENIDALWETIMFRIMSSNYDHTETLIEILLYFIKLYNSISDRPTLKIQDVENFEEFDSSIHIRNPESKTSGKIIEVILPGYVIVATDNIVKKSIVKVG